MLHSLNSIINQDVALSCNMASYKTWSEGTGQNASLDEINDKCESAKDEVSSEEDDRQIVSPVFAVRM